MPDVNIVIISGREMEDLRRKVGHNTLNKPKFPDMMCVILSCCRLELKASVTRPIMDSTFFTQTDTSTATRYIT